MLSHVNMKGGRCPASRREAEQAPPQFSAVILVPEMFRKLRETPGKNSTKFRPNPSPGVRVMTPNPFFF